MTSIHKINPYILLKKLLSLLGQSNFYRQSAANSSQFLPQIHRHEGQTKTIFSVECNKAQFEAFNFFKCSTSRALHL